MKKKSYNNNKPFKVVTAIVIIILLLFSWWRNNDLSTDGQKQDVIAENVALTYTKHARCRMDCRNISEEEIREVLREGIINQKKSNNNQKPCPTYAIEDRVKDGTKLRIVFAKCPDQIKVITCIDLENEFECDCY
ncbi:MAG TPA: DUF4258 domain-containing protein [Edaphocola sp.]|nr:DUF4258 domain-containing protein [Edaphocola sp.]